ncbi:MucR family transcriptional regulator [Pseudorhizobium flavum]|uniref:MucR family transcriptional regulator n=1 Tax=Pseudorhizobium flavum TaxID=1335061 RepID=UPI00098546B3
MREGRPGDDDLRRGARIVEAYLRYNHVSISELPRVVEIVYSTIASLSLATPKAKSPRPSVSLKDVTREGIACFECGRRVQLLKRHIRDHHNLTAEEYRRRWGLSVLYPMVTPQLSAVRSAVAKKAILERLSDDLHLNSEGDIVTEKAGA